MGTEIKDEIEKAAERLTPEDFARDAWFGLELLDRAVRSLPVMGFVIDRFVMSKSTAVLFSAILLRTRGLAPREPSRGMPDCLWQWNGFGIQVNDTEGHHFRVVARSLLGPR